MQRFFLQDIHKKTKRDYLFRVRDGQRAKYAKIAKEYGYEYWDGDRRYCYGGYHYDGRWKVVAERLIDAYGLNNTSKVLDVGCGKGFLLYEIYRLIPAVTICGFDISEYALNHVPDDIKPFVFKYRAEDIYPYEDKYFDLVISVNVLHNLYIYDFKKAIQEIERVSKSAYIVMDSYRTEEEKDNLLNWQMTCELFFTPKEWLFLFEEYKYSGDWEFIFFE